MGSCGSFGPPPDSLPRVTALLARPAVAWPRPSCPAAQRPGSVAGTVAAGSGLSGGSPPASHGQVLPKHRLCTLHTGVRHDPCSRGAHARTARSRDSDSARWVVGGRPQDWRLGPTRGAPCWMHCTPTPPPPRACGGQGPRCGAADSRRHICACTRPRRPFSTWDVWGNTATGLPIPRVLAAGPPRPVQGSPQNPSCSSLDRPACHFLSSRPGEPFLVPAVPLGPALAAKAGQPVSGALWTL